MSLVCDNFLPASRPCIPDDASVSQPGNNAQPEIVHPAEAGSSSSQPGETLAKTLLDINVNMCTMASLLQTIVARQD